MLEIKRYHFDSILSIVLIIILVLHYAKFLSIFDTNILAITAILGTLPVLWSAVRSIFEDDWASMDTLASIALIFSLLANQWSSAVFISLMLAAARILGDLTQAQMKKSIKGLLKLRPDKVQVERGEKIEIIPLMQVMIGDVVVVDLSDRIPVDGIVISGNASVDESSLTGESLPIEKTVGSKVYSSTLVMNGGMRIKTELVGKDTTLERIINLVESARSEKPKTQTLGEKFGKIYLISMIILSGVLFLVTHNLMLVLAVVLVVCADDIAVAIPIAYLRGISAAAHRGIIIKGAMHLETLGKAQIFVFDKTGTLTRGKLAVSNIVPAEGYTERDVLEFGIFAAERSKHPIDLAVMTYALSHGVVKQELDSFEEISGKGIKVQKSGNTVVLGRETFLKSENIIFSPELEKKASELSDKGLSISYVAKNGKTIGFAAVSDEIKSNAKQAIEELKSLGVKKVVMLTGDNERVARNVAEKLGITDFRSGLLPEDKVNTIKELHKEGIVVMVGDGVNDAAALSVAHVGIAMGAMGVDGAIESAEIVLMRDDLTKIAETIRLARKVEKVSIQDFWIWGITNTAGLAFVFGGLIGPSGAAAYNFISDFFPLMNSVRVRTNKIAE